MTRPRRVLLVGGKDETLVLAGALGLEVFLLQHPDKVTAFQQTAVKCHVVDYTDWAAARSVVEAVHHSFPFEAAMSLTEAGVETSGRVNDLFGLGGTGHAVARRFRNKAEMRYHLAAAGFDDLACAALVERSDMDQFAARCGFPFVVKPADATAGVGVRIVRGSGELDQAWAAVEAARGTRTDRGSTLYTLDGFVMEAYVEGPEFSVESLSYNGHHVAVAVTEKFVDAGSTTEVGHVVPARAPAAVQEDIRRYVSEFLTVMGLRDGPCRTELRLGEQGPRVIESHNRPGGGAIPDLVEAVTGVNMPAQALAAPFGLLPEPADVLPARGGAASRFLVGRPGRVTGISGFAELQARKDVLAARALVALGAAVGPVKDNWDRLGLVAVSSSGPNEALSLAQDLAREHVHIELTGDDGQRHEAFVAPMDAAPARWAVEVAS